MKKSILLTLLVFTSLMVFSQDVIIKTSGERIKCKITDVDSTNIYFTVTRNNNHIPTFIKKSSVQEIQYGAGEVVSYDYMYQSPDNTQTTQAKVRNCIIVGFLYGGGSLIGFDFEALLVNRLGLQAGAGYVGFGGGINIHLKPTVRSSYLSLQYWHQGAGNTYTQSLLGPSFVFRGKKWFTAQIGLGFILENGPAWPENVDPIPVMLTYAIGAYFPW